MKTFLFYALGGSLVVALVAYTFQYAVEYSAFAAGLAKAYMAIGVFHLFDLVVMREVDTITELKNGNVAYGIFLAAVAVLFAAAIATA